MVYYWILILNNVIIQWFTNRGTSDARTTITLPTAYTTTNYNIAFSHNNTSGGGISHVWFCVKDKTITSFTSYVETSVETYRIAIGY